ncbi:MAG: DUF3443 domain-containing protein [Acidobacteriia bacterium]|nr:DUF3443 domain-containing protein [Terriglobia bacterium]
MKVRKGSIAKLVFSLGLSAGLLVLASCGNGGGSSTNTNPPPVSNTQPMEVNLGPANNYTNGLFTDVTLCVPGSSSCQTINNVLVDSGSVGLRILSSQVTLSLPAITDNSSNGLQECLAFADGSYLWGAVQAADVKLAGEKAASVPLQMINAPNTGLAVPSQCLSSGGANVGTVTALGANGILGIGNFRQDCGGDCTGASSQVPALYYLCPNTVCQVASVPLAFQLQNPVWLFPQDNNGVLISLPSIPADGAPTVSGSLIFGIGTQSNNGLGTARIYTTDAFGNFQTTFNNIAYSQSFIDSGSNGFYFLDAQTLGIPDCSDLPGFYCPASTVNSTATNTGLNGTTAQVSFSIANADALFSANSGSNAAFNDLGGDNPGGFDWGMPFFFGRNVFVGIEGQTGPNGVVGPYWAYGPGGASIN